MNKPILLVAVILSAMVLLPFLPISQAQINLNNITNVNPGDSIQQAIYEANEGDTIIVSSGIYYEHNIIVNKSVTIVGANKETTIIDAEENPGAIFVIGADGVEIRNLTLQNTFSAAGYGISLDSFRNAVVSDCTIKQCYQAVGLANGTDCTLARNVIKDNYYCGIYLHYYSSYNYIYGNSIKNNTIGVYIDNVSKENRLYHNNFLNNTNYYGGFGITANYWNETYPSGGNFWSNYTGVDLYSGFYQNETGSDGVGDKNYTIYGDTVDFYPLMAPVHFLNAGRWNEQEYYVAIATKSNVSDFRFYPAETPPFVSFNVSNHDANFCRVTIPKKLLSVAYLVNWTVLVNQNPPDVLNMMEDSDYTYLYFTLNNTVSAIKISGTYAIPELPQLILLTTFVATTVAVLIGKRKRFSKHPPSCKNQQFPK
jgi:parallel beta-helix repeat protein